MKFVEGEAMGKKDLMTKTEQKVTVPSAYNMFYAILMLITWFIIFYIIDGMRLESAIILSLLTAILTLIIPKFKYLIEKKSSVGKVKILILILIPSFSFLMGIVGLLYFLIGFTGEDTFMIALSSYALVLMLIPVKTSNIKRGGN